MEINNLMISKMLFSSNEFISSPLINQNISGTDFGQSSSSSNNNYYFPFDDLNNFILFYQQQQTAFQLITNNPSIPSNDYLPQQIPSQQIIVKQFLKPELLNKQQQQQNNNNNNDYSQNNLSIKLEEEQIKKIIKNNNNFLEPMQRGRTCSEPISNSSLIQQSSFSNNLLTNCSTTSSFNNLSSSSNSNLSCSDSIILLCEWIGCSKHFIGRQNFLKHIQNEHLLLSSNLVNNNNVGNSNNSPICYWRNCPRGGRPFGALYMLQQHLRAHTGEKPYQCLIKNCGKRYSRLENLKTHTRKHTGERPYRCNSCNSDFTNASDRSKHVERVHGGKKRYRCTNCQCAYTDPSSLRKHILNAHGQLEWIAYKNRRQYERQNIIINK